MDKCLEMTYGIRNTALVGDYKEYLVGDVLFSLHKILAVTSPWTQLMKSSATLIIDLIRTIYVNQMPNITLLNLLSLWFQLHNYLSIKISQV